MKEGMAKKDLAAKNADDGVKKEEITPKTASNNLISSASIAPGDASKTHVSA